MGKLFDLNFYNKDIDSLVKELHERIEKNEMVSVFTPNVDHIINNNTNKLALNFYSQSEYIIADGWPLVAVSLLKKTKISRITGVDLMDQMLKLASEEKMNIFFLGATDNTLLLLKENIKKDYPNISEINTHNGFFDDDVEVVEAIRRSNSQMLFVGMGNPKQEIWIRKYMNELKVNVSVGVGGAFNIYSGEVSRAPKWVQNIGMEWFYRFLKEPKRLFYRYFVKYPRFIRIMYKEFKK